MTRELRNAFALGLGMVLLLAQGALQAQVKFERTRHDFGEIKEEAGKVSTVFAFQNGGGKPVRIVSVKATCGCTTPVWSRDSIPAGESGMVKVEYDPLGRPGPFAKEILVETDGSPSHVSLFIQGKVAPRPKGPEDYYPFDEGSLRMRSNHFTFGTIYHDDTVTLSTVLYNQGKKPLQFNKSASKVPTFLKPRMSKTTLAPGDTLTLWVSYVAPLRKDWGFLFDNIYLATNDEDRPMKRINVSATVAERFTAAHKAAPPRLALAKSSFEFGQITEGEMPTATFAIKNTGKSPLLMRKLSAACSCITVTGFKSLAPGESAEVTLQFNSRGRIGEFDKDAVLITNDPAEPSITLQISGTVVRKAPQD